MSDRELILQAVQKMPEEASALEIMSELALLESVREGLSQSQQGGGVPQEQVVSLLRKWVTESCGPDAASKL